MSTASRRPVSSRAEAVAPDHPLQRLLDRPNPFWSKGDLWRDKLGPNATLLTGMLGAVEGIPVIVSEQMKLADTDGKVTDPGNGTNTGRLMIVNRTQWAQGFRRELTLDVDRDTQKRQTVVTESFRHALTERSGGRSTATHAALQYNITGVT